MKFIRKNGRIIPISDKKDSPKKSGSIGAGTVVAGATAVTAATGAGAIAAGKHLVKKAGNIFNGMHHLNQITMGLGDGKELKALTGMIQKGRKLQATGKNLLKGSAIAGGLLGLGALAGLYNKYKSKK